MKFICPTERFGAIVWSFVMHASIRLYLTRHGRTAWNHVGRFQGHTDIPLDEVGRAQSVELARKLRGTVDAVLASDLQRASETARIVAEVLAIPMLGLDADLRERGYGIFEGLTREECIQRHPAVWAARGDNRNFEPPGSEPCAEVNARMLRGLTRAVDAFGGRHERLLVVGHGSALRMFLERITGASVSPLSNLQYREVVHDGLQFVCALQDPSGHT